MALAAVRQWQDEVLGEVEGMGAKSLLWYRVLDAWREARAVTGQPVPEPRGALAGDDEGAARRGGGAGEDGRCGVALDPAHSRPAPIG